MKHWYYLHENNELIHKNDYEGIVGDFRESDLVHAFWSFDTEDRESAWDLLVEAGSLGANKERIKELAAKWGCDDNDAKVYCERIGVIAKMDGNMWCCHTEDFINLQESPCGFGETILDALIELCKELGFLRTKLGWHARFAELVKVPKQKELAE